MTDSTGAKSGDRHGQPQATSSSCSVEQADAVEPGVNAYNGTGFGTASVEANYGTITTKLFARGSRGSRPSNLDGVGRGVASATGRFDDSLTVTKPGGGFVELRLRLTLEGDTTFLDRPVCPDRGLQASVTMQVGLTLEQGCNDGAQTQHAEQRIWVHVPAGGETALTLRGELKSYAMGQSDWSFPHDVSAAVGGPTPAACRAVPNPQAQAARLTVNVDVMTDGGDYTAKGRPDYRSDTVSPVTTSSVAPAPNAAGWNRDTTAVNLQASDLWRVKSITYSATGAQPLSTTTVDGASATVPITAEGETQVEYHATDCNGNLEPAKVVLVRVDKQSPTVSAEARYDDGSPYTGGWTNRPVTVSFTCADETAGLADGCPAPSRIVQDSPSTAGTTVSSGPVHDRAGNTTTTSTVVKFDGSAPAITHIEAVSSGTGAPYESGAWSNSAVLISWQCSDSGHAGVQPGDDSAWITESRAFTPRCQDRAGNVTEGDQWNVRIDPDRTPQQYPIDFAEAMAADRSLVTGATLVSGGVYADTVGVVGEGWQALVGAPPWFDVGMPTHGPTTAVLGTGPVYNGVEWGSFGNMMAPPDATPERGEGAFDVSTVRIDILVPQDATCLGFDWSLVLAREFAHDGEGYGRYDDDVFLAELDSSTWTMGTSGLSAPNDFAGPNDIPAHAQTAVTPGQHSLYLSIFDGGDAYGDSVALIDNLTATADC